MKNIKQQFQTPVGYVSIAVGILGLLTILNTFTGIFSPATVCPQEKERCSPMESLQYIDRDMQTGTGFTLETLNSLFDRQSESVLLEVKKTENMGIFEGQFRAYIASRRSSFTGTGSILPYTREFLQKGTITNLEFEYFSLAMNNAIKTELKNFLVKTEASLVATYEKEYERKLPLVFDPASSIRLFEQLQNTYNGSGQLFIVENMSRASEVAEGDQYDYVDWTATIRTSLPYLTRFLEDLEKAQSLKENNSILNLPFFIVQQAKLTFLGDTPTSSSEDAMQEVRAEIVLRMYLAKITEDELRTKRDEVQKQLDTAKQLAAEGRQLAPSSIAKYDQLILLGNERVELYRAALRANNIRVAYNELTTLQEIYTELLTYFS